MRSSHAKRDGKTFSWDDPPEGGHPGEAPGCRCSAEDVEKKDCEKIAEERDAAWERYEALFEPVEKLKWEVKVSEERLNDLKSELSVIKHKLSRLGIPDAINRSRSKINVVIGGIQILLGLSDLLMKQAQLEHSIEIEEWSLDSKTKCNTQLCWGHNGTYLQSHRTE